MNSPPMLTPLIFPSPQSRAEEKEAAAAHTATNRRNLNEKKTRFLIPRMKQKRIFLAHLAMVFVPKALTEYFNQTGATTSNCSEVFIPGRERFESVALCTLGARQAPSYSYVVAQRQFFL